MLSAGGQVHGERVDLPAFQGDRGSMATLDYVVTPVNAAAHRFRVEMRTRVVPGAQVQLQLPCWIPGSYVIRDFARHLLSITAESGDQPVALRSVDRQCWECTPGGGDLTVRCEFYARDPSVRTAFLDDRRGFLNFTSLCLRPVGRETDACRVRLDPPPGINHWTLVTTLTAQAVDGQGFGRYHADDYWALIDHPVAMGEAVDRVAFEVRGVPHAFVLLGGHDADTRRLATDLAAVCAAQSAVFDTLPAREYLFLAQITGGGYGGLEHRESSVLQVPRHSLPSPAIAPGTRRDEAYETLLGLCSHEYFHLWNVKRIRPEAVANSDLSTEAYFRDLWAYEGVTSYYDDLGLVRAGLIDEAGYLDRLAKLATRIDRGPGRRRQSLAQSSFDAWLKFYRPDENTPNAVVSYYGKGAQLALALDLKLRVETDEAVSLDDVMRRLWREHGEHDTPVSEGGLARTAAEISGLELAGFFERHLETVADAPWAEWLGHFGICATPRPADDDEGRLLGRLGLRLSANSLPTVAQVLDDSPAQVAGLSPGDRLVAFDGLEAGPDLAARLLRYPAGARVRVHLFRDSELLAREVELAAQSALEWHLCIDAAADARAHARRKRWLQHDRIAA